MKSFKTPLALLISSALLAGCNTTDTEYVEVQPTEVKIATYNLSFDRFTFEALVAEMQVAPEEQTELVTAYLDDSIELSDSDTELAEKIIQIRNVAAILQKNRPDVLMMAEFNNDGTGEDKEALKGFQDNYLSVSQSIDGANGEANLEPIQYPYFESYSTNTGLLSDLDLNRDGEIALPDDAWGFGFYHGQYAFALASKYEIDSANTRTFQEFKWKDLEGSTNPTITVCDGSLQIPDGMACGDEWYTAKNWEEIRLSSKNHVDAPIIIPTQNGNEVVHLLMSHPTPPVFDLGKNKEQNAAEVEFWHQYVQGKEFIYDDAGKTGGLATDSNFVIMGDLNLDPLDGDGITEVMQELHNDPLLNQAVMNGDLYPTSYGAAEDATDNASSHPLPNRVTSTFGLAVDYAMPSATLNIVDSGVYWSASYEEGRMLFNDERVGNWGNEKEISSDHRMVWIKAQF
ncbi:succinyl-CoA synthetase subunit alpha [Vibrio sp. 10N.286.49.B3]|uniref:endonuclease/exonuclease/phosphatase family protein n=1 Tax=Vibrio sp. 10N.286.49.B3 TaxID=1880855 RepID=UPI000C84C749|nr:endonuclease/exonuclease/phosphatase family protein [Vibrio sp. 10N.286.49.B3]PMH43250.1 succinyl-CoA synthetase subunit alpha [Vibrio sp. 10N.286.49.B3]